MLVGRWLRQEHQISCGMTVLSYRVTFTLTLLLISMCLVEKCMKLLCLDRHLISVSSVSMAGIAGLSLEVKQCCTQMTILFWEHI